MSTDEARALHTLWIDHEGHLTAKKEDGYSMPLYSAEEVDQALAAARAEERRRVWEEAAKMIAKHKNEWTGIAAYSAEQTALTLAYKCRQQAQEGR